jgi:hypothetical protein
VTKRKYDESIGRLDARVLADQEWVARRLDIAWQELACKHGQSAAALLIRKATEDAVPKWFRDLFAYDGWQTLPPRLVMPGDALPPKPRAPWEVDALQPVAGMTGDDGHRKP